MSCVPMLLVTITVFSYSDSLVPLQLKTKEQTAAGVTYSVSRCLQGQLLHLRQHTSYTIYFSKTKSTEFSTVRAK